MWGVWLTGAVYVSRIGNTVRVPYGDPNRDSLSQVVSRIMDRWEEAKQERKQRILQENEKNKMV